MAPCLVDYSGLALSRFDLGLLDHLDHGFECMHVSLRRGQLRASADERDLSQDRRIDVLQVRIVEDWSDAVVNEIACRLNCRLDCPVRHYYTSFLREWT